jgi:acyl-homoserine-lactone acylase
MERNMSNKASKLTVALATACLLIACGGGSDSSRTSVDTDANSTKLRWTDYGIVHIEADNYRGLGYGYAYAVAEENLCRVAEVYITVNGERSKYFGADGSWLFASNYTVNNNLDSDFFFALLNAEKRVEKLLAMAPPNGPKAELRELVRGYVAGYNQYLRDTGVNKLPDPSCRGADWVREITELDVYRHVYKLAIMASSGVAIEGIGSAQPPFPSQLPSQSGATQASSTLSPLEIARQIAEGWKQVKIGSNAIALGGDATDTGRGMLLGNPHFPWYGAERFYQVHMTIPGELNVTGGSLIGLPLVLIGYNKDLAWSHTVASGFRFTPYHLNLVPGDPTSYLVDGQPEAMTPWNLTVNIKQPDGSLGTAERTLYTTRWGPVFTNLLGLPLFPWLPTEAYAMADANANNFRLINHFFDTSKASSSRELHEVLIRNQGVPWVNTIAADRDGDAFYADITVSPNVSDSQAVICTSALGLVTNQVLGLPVLDGSRSTCAWEEDSDAIESGRIGPSRMPHIYRRDYVSNSNDSYWLTNAEAPLEGFPRIIGDERTERRMRTRLGIKMINERLSGSDGLPGKTFSRQQLQDLLFNNRNHAAELWGDSLVSLCRTLPVMIGLGGPVLTSEACNALEAWDRTNKLDSPGALLFARFVANAHVASVPSGTASSALNFVDLWTTPFDANNPVNTPSGLNILNPHVELALANAISDLQGAGFDMDASLRESQYVQRGDEIIPIHGGHGEFGMFNDIQATWDPEVGYSDVYYGASFIQVVSFDDDECPDARTMLTYSQSVNPESKHYADQTRLYSNSGWVDAQFCESEIKDRVTRTIRLSH